MLKYACLVVVSIVFLVSCGESASSTTRTDPEPSLPTTAAADPVTAELRGLAFAYWDAFNGYDADLVLSYLEDTYRVAHDESIRTEIGSISAFGIQLGVQEEGPPVVLDDGTAEIFIELREPLGTRRIRMAFAQIDGDWMITFAEESD